MRHRTLAALAVGAAAAAGTAPTRACTSTLGDRYDSVVNVGLGFGFSVLPRFAVTYGLDLRFGHGPAIGFARIEGHGLNHVRYSLGLKLIHPATGAEFEAGFALNSAHVDSDVEKAWGLHLAGGRWNPGAEAQIQGMIPLHGDRHNYEAGLAAFFAVPGNWLYAIGCNG